MLFFHEALKRLVVENHIVTYDYFVNKMDLMELFVLLNLYSYSDRNLWEGFRLILWLLSCIYSKNSPKLTEVLSFPWDNEVEDRSKDISNDDIERLKKLAAKLEKKK